MALRARFIVVALVFAGACALFPSLDVGPTDASTNDDGAPADVRTDVINNMGSDAQPDAPRFCATHADASFCDDFDDGMPLGALWGPPDIQVDGGYVIIDSDASVSSPSALLAGIAANDAGNPSASVSAVMGSTTKGLHLEFDLLLEQNDPNGGLFALALRVGPGTDATKYILTLHTISSNRMQLQEQGPASDASPSSMQTTLGVVPLMGTWSHLILDVDLVGKTVGLMVDGMQAVGPMPCSTQIATGSVSLRIGLTYSNGTHPALRDRFDNVLLNLE